MISIHQGVDIVEITKFRNVLIRSRGLVSEIFTRREREYCEAMKDPFPHFAGRFAAKESYLKALGTGMSGYGIDHVLQEIEVVPDASGKPGLSVNGWAAKIAAKRKIQQSSVSIAHSANYAVATVILLSN